MKRNHRSLLILALALAMVFTFIPFVNTSNAAFAAGPTNISSLDLQVTVPMEGASADDQLTFIEDDQGQADMNDRINKQNYELDWYSCNDDSQVTKFVKGNSYYCVIKLQTNTHDALFASALSGVAYDYKINGKSAVKVENYAWDGSVNPEEEFVVLTSVNFEALDKTTIQNGVPFTPEEGVTYKIKLNANEDVTFRAESGTVHYYSTDKDCKQEYSNSGPFEYKAAALRYHTFQGCSKGYNYFRFTGNLTQTTAEWEEVEVTNSSLEDAEALSLGKGKTKTVNMDGGEYGRGYYYTMNLTVSGKYTFNAKESSVIYILKGIKDKDGENYWKYIRSSDANPAQTIVMPKGEYTVIAYPVPSNSTGTITIKRLDWTGISKITCDSTYTGTYGSTITYKVKYEPKDADSVITIKGTSYKTAGSNITKVSQKDGVATFKIKISTLYDPDQAKKYRTYKVSTTEGITKSIEEKGGPKAAKIKTVEGAVTGGSVKVEKGQADKLVIQVKNGTSWKTLKTAKNLKAATPTISFAGLSAGKTYNLRVVSYTNGVKGGNKTFKMITAYNTKPTNIKATCISTKYKKGKGEYLVFEDGKWVTKIESNKSVATIKVTFTKAKNTSYTEVNYYKLASGKTFTLLFEGKLTKAKTVTLYVRGVRKKDGLIAYGPIAEVKCTVKKAS